MTEQKGLHPEEKVFYTSMDIAKTTAGNARNPYILAQRAKDPNFKEDVVSKLEIWQNFKSSFGKRMKKNGPSGGAGGGGAGAGAGCKVGMINWFVSSSSSTHLIPVISPLEPLIFMSRESHAQVYLPMPPLPP